MSIRQSLWIIFLLTSQVALVAQTIDSTVVRKVDSLIQVNRSLVSSGNLKEALAIIREADSLAVEKLGTKNVSHALCVFNIGRTYDYAGRSVETKENYLEAIRLWEKEIGQLDAGYCWALNNMAIYHLERYQYEEAAPYYARCIEASEKILGNNNRDYGFFLTNWANYYKAKAQFEAELKLRYKAKDVFENASGKGSDDYAWCLIELSNCYQAMGRYGQVTEMLLEAQAAMGNSLGTSHRYYASCLNNLATNYERTGEFSKVEPLYKEAINIILNRTPLNQQSYGLFSNNLAVYYYKIGQYEDSEHIFVSLREVWRKAFGEKSTSFAFYITNHANLYLRQERYEMADSLFRMAMDIRRELAVTQHPNYANILYGLGSVKLETGDPTEAEKLFLEAKDIYAATQGMEHPNYSKSLRGLANAYAAQGKCLEADTTMLDAVNILSRSVDKQHPKYVATLSDLASNYLRCGQTVRAGTPLMETEVLNRLYMSRAQYFLTEQEMDQYVKGSVQQTESFLSYLYNQKTTSSGLLQTAWDDALFYKGMLQEKNRSLQFFIQNTSDSVQTISDHWKSCHRGLADLYAKSPAQRDSSSVAILQRQAAEAEKQLVRLSAGFAEARRQVSVTEVDHSLEKNEAAIEFLQFHFYDSRNQKTDSTRYVAMVVLPNDTVPAWIPLFEEKQLQALLDKTGDKAQATSTLYAARTGKVLDQAPAYGTELYNLIWRPLDSLLRGVKT
ncbi:MAG: tetratricopeptide repeat protein, partial [Saprospiraceae bacterium]|nr:tetratricopeptide repeat protein [Saprospiraceae bacterium]